MTSDARLPELLKTHFGYDSFRPLQREIIEAALAGRDVLAVLPTGAGKSLCYQLPALARTGVTLVVSPLIALMKDQVDQLTASGIPATFLNSSLSVDEMRERLDDIRAGTYRLVYLAPERLMSGDFLAIVRTWNVTALAIDEAHCISEWGHDFRPEYRRLKELRAILPEVPAIALTATATPRVREDILVQLGLADPADFLASFNRPNLNYQVESKQDAASRIASFARRRKGESGIVYCQSRRRTEELAASLRAAGVPALCYHAGLDASARAANQDAFLRDETQIVCATVAFGMGINKPDVRFVIHADLPKNLEGYYQETGRAGRDGLPADCLLLFSRSDIMKQKRFLDEIQDPEARDNARRQLERMADYAEADECRRIELLGYFGETWPADGCGACDNCLAPRETWDATLETQKLLSCALRVRQAGSPAVGVRYLTEILTGSRSSRLLARGHDALSTYGIGRELSATAWAEIARQLVRKGWFAIDPGEFPTVSVTPTGMEILRSRATVHLTRTLADPKPASRRSGEIECDPGLFERLRAQRKATADAAGVPPYVVFSDVALRHMARAYPTDESSLRHIPGVGERKLADYGGTFLGEISAWLTDHPRLEFQPIRNDDLLDRATPRTAPAPTALVSLNLWRDGKSVEEIAAERNLATTTIENHLAQAIETGEWIDPTRLYSEAEATAMEAAFNEFDEPTLKPVFVHLEGRISYGKLRLFRAIQSRVSASDPADSESATATR